MTGLFISKTDGGYFEQVKTYIATVLEESTDIKKTENDITEAFAKIKTRLAATLTISRIKTGLFLASYSAWSA